MELSPMDATNPLRLGQFIIYLDIVLKIALIVFLIVAIAAIIYGILSLKRFIDIQKEKASISTKDNE